MAREEYVIMQDFKTGVTLLELLLVISLLAIVASMIYPMLSGSIRQSHISSATWTVATALEQARSRGLMDLVDPIATFTRDSGNYIVGRQSYTMDNGCQISWTDASIVTKALTFTTYGEATWPSSLGPSTPQELLILAPQVGGQGRIFIATSGFITWVTDQ